MKSRKNVVFTCVSVACLSLSSNAFADNYQEDMQARLNEQVLSKPFNVQDDATLSKSLDDATERGKPTKSKTQDGYYRYQYNGYYYPHPYSWYRYYGYW